MALQDGNGTRFCGSRLVTGRPIEDEQEVPAADLSNLIRGEGSFQHRINNDVVEAGRLILPSLIGALSGMGMLLAGAGGSAPGSVTSTNARTFLA